MGKVYALSIKQPWATLLVAGRKTIEIRSWATKIRGRVLIHAARIPDSRPEGWRLVTDDLRELVGLGGGIIGVADLIDCLKYGDSKGFSADVPRHLNEPAWFQPRGLFGFVFRQAATLPFIQVPGNVRFFTVEGPR